MSNTKKTCKPDQHEGMETETHCKVCGCDFSRDIDFLTSDSWDARFILFELKKGKQVFFGYCGEILDRPDRRSRTRKVPSFDTVAEVRDWIRSVRS